MNPTLESVISKHKGDISSCDFGPRERLATASSDHDVRIFDYNDRQQKYVENSRLSPISHHIYRLESIFTANFCIYICLMISSLLKLFIDH